jgi:hypothetical protein
MISCTYSATLFKQLGTLTDEDDTGKEEDVDTEVEDNTALSDFVSVILSTEIDTGDVVLLVILLAIVLDPNLKVGFTDGVVVVLDVAPNMLGAFVDIGGVEEVESPETLVVPVPKLKLGGFTVEGIF